MNSYMPQQSQRCKVRVILPVQHELSAAAAWLVHHRRVPRELALVVAELAGLGGTEEAYDG